MFKRRNFIKGLAGLIAVPFLPVVNFIRPKKPYSLSAEVLKLQMEHTRQMQALFQPAMDRIYQEWIKENGLERVVNTPADPGYVKARLESIEKISFL